MNMKSNWKAWLVAILAALLCLPLLIEYMAILHGKDYYKLWPGCVLLAGFIFIRRWMSAAPAERHAPRWTVTLLLIVAFPLILFSLLYYTQWGMAFAFLILMGAGACYLSRHRKVENLLGLYLLFLVLLRPPYQLLLRIMAWMENLSIQTASTILDYQSVIHVVQGNILALPKHDFGIDVMCSSWVSLVSTLATASFLCVIRNRRVLHCFSVLFLAIVSTWILNFLRIFTVVSVSIWYEVDLLSGAYFALYHAVSFLVALLLVLSSDALILFCFSGLGGEVVESNRPRQKKAGLIAFWRRLYDFKFSDILHSPSSEEAKVIKIIPLSLTVLSLVLLIGVEALVLYYRPVVTRRELMFGEDDLSKITDESVVFRRAGWTVVDYNEEKREMASTWGALSSIWRLKYSGITVVMALDYPFDDWHDVKRCYSNIGWKIKNERIVEELPAFQWRASQTDMVLPNGDAGYILCSHNDHFGKPVQPKPAQHDWTMLAYRLHPDKMSPPFGAWDKQGSRTYYQTQCMVATPVPLDALTRKEIRMMYAEFRGQIRQAIELKYKVNQNNPANE